LQVIADKTAHPGFVASDLVAQAEHGVDSQVVVVCVDLSDKEIEAIQDAIKEQALAQPRVDFLRKSLANSLIVKAKDLGKSPPCLAQRSTQLAFVPCRSLTDPLYCLFVSPEQGIKFSNAYAPEHLVLLYEGAAASVPRIKNAGSVFVGPWSPVSMGDYASGTNHTVSNNSSRFPSSQAAC
jgi:phosphoribosyl-ATP pyrophosphohydrolase/phosphoribosyl-AMP cyclohydrolase/histidinol dehydrogenase